MMKLFEETLINSMSLKNRFIRSATWEGMAAEDGSGTRKLDRLVARLADGGVGLIISGHAYVQCGGQAGPFQLGAYKDDLIPGLRKISEAVHMNHGKIVLQLTHAGCFSSIQLTGTFPMGPSVIKYRGKQICREMTKREIEDMIRAFAHGAMRAKQAGFDGVQLHAAHGYLLSQFLSPYFNKRTDEYGGTLEKRVRIVIEVVSKIRSMVGDEFPVLIKMNSEDFLDDGLTQNDMIRSALILSHTGVDGIELSGGTGLSAPNTPIRKGRLKDKGSEVFYREAAKRFKAEVDIPLMLVGGIRSYDVAKELVEGNSVDFISLCRPLIREPGLIKRWNAGDRCKSTCLSDNLCFKPANAGKGLYCVVREKRDGG